MGRAVKIRYLGHAAFEIRTEEKIILIDPFLEGNPRACARAEDFEKVDLIFVTHAHADHLGDAVEIAKRTNAKVVCMYDIAQYLFEKFGVETIGMNYGYTRIDGVEVIMVPAWHSSSFEGKMLGNSCGFIIGAEGKRVYHAGDTCVFGDMKLFAELYPIDIALLPIGGHFTMDVKQAVKACELLKPKMVIPMHYNTWPVIRAEPEKLREVEKSGIEVRILEPGEEVEV